MKKNYFKEFLHRGLIFGGFGPIIAGIVFFVLSLTLESFSLSGQEMLLAIVSTYLLAFLQAGASVFNQIESWSVAKSMLCHFAIIYLAYVACYLLNSWIPFDIKVILIFTAIFVVLYLVIWLSVFFAVRATSKRLNARVK
ncbi:MAG: DUF3021 domain-containing protein [Ruminococcaceae bacterium]|nr:DUF3021 domain-containing protein [Oscillospiraceae bacterium]